MPAEQLENPIISRREFAQNLADSGLFDLNDLLPESESAVAPDGAGTARELIAAGKLTGYQADAIIRRKFTDLLMGNYEILDRLGAGGMGTVYKARHRRMKRIVALKVLSKEVAASEKFAQRFQREIETIARLTHPNIVMAFDADEAEAGPFLVMEFVNGRDLAWEVATNGPLPIDAAVDCIVQSARGLEYAHAQGIIHRDIKPGNLLRDTTGLVKVADLGLARFRESDSASAVGSITQAGTVCGTIDYMSPEQAVDSAAVDQRTDTYSLGCTLYFLLTGQPIYQGVSLMSVMLKHRDAPIPVLHAARPDVPAELDAIFHRMVAKRVEDRYPSLTEAIKDLERVLAGLLPTEVATPGQSAARTLNPSDRTVDFDSQELAGLHNAGFELSPPEPPGPSKSDADRLAVLTVVLAEPSRTQAGIIRSYLQQLGVTTTHITGSGQEAIATVKRVGAHVVVSSLHLSDMTGPELAVALRADSECAQVGFVLATSDTYSEMTAALPRDARTAIMTKPFDPDRLARSITSVIR